MGHQLDALELAQSVIGQRTERGRKLEDTITKMDRLALAARVAKTDKEREAILREINNLAGNALNEERSFSARDDNLRERSIRLRLDN